MFGFRAFVERTGFSPTCRELGDAVGMSAVGAWKHLQALVAGGTLVKAPKAPRKRASGVAVTLPERANLAVVPTEQLRGELARRGVTLDALAQPEPLMDEGRCCAANFCRDRVGRGMLMCRSHWFRLPIQMRRAITNAWGARQMRAYQEAVEAARDFLGGFTRVVERVL
jgi:hypothetical protein